MAAAQLIITRITENGKLADLIIEGEGFDPPQITLDLNDPDDTVQTVLTQIQTMGWHITTQVVIENTTAQHTTRYTLEKR